VPPIRRILSVSRDRAVMLARNDALAVAGFSVVSPRHPGESAQILATSDIDIILLGHSIPYQERTDLVHRYREMGAKAPVIVLYDGQPQEGEVADAFVSIDDGPEELIHAIDECLKTRSRES